MYHRHLFIFFAIGCLAPLTAGALATDNGRDAAPQLESIARAAATVQTLAADFVQEKHLQMLEDVHTARGRFYFQKPDRLRWELTEPTAYGFSVNGKKARRWRGRKGLSRTFDLQKMPILKVIVTQVFAWATADFKQLEDNYRIRVTTAEPIIIKLEPRTAQEQQFVDHILLTFADDHSYVRLVEVHEKGGDTTRINFTNTVVNGTLAQDLF